MKQMQIFEPAMCCSTGLCGAVVNPELLRITANLNNLKNHGIVVDRYNLNSAPQEFVANKKVFERLKATNGDCLPMVVVDGEIVIEKRYPTDEEFCELLKIPCEYLSQKNNCCGGSCSCKNGCK